MSSPSPPIVMPPRPRRKIKRQLAAWVWILGFCLAALIATYMMFVEPPPPRKIVIASGSRNGAYFRYAQQYAEELQKEGLSVEVRETAGSVENLRLLGQDGSGVAVAIVQSGVAGPEELERCYALGSLYREPLWVFYRGDKPLERLSQLAGKRIGVGPAGSGTYAIAMQLLAANGLIESRSESTEQDARIVLVRGERRRRGQGVAEGRAGCRVLRRRLRGRLHPGPAERSCREAAELRPARGLSSPFSIPGAGHRAGGPGEPGPEPSRPGRRPAGADRHAGRPQGFPPRPGPAPARDRQATSTASGDELSDPGEFPSESYCDFPVSEDAKHFYKSGQPVLQRLLPFWLASLVDRAKVMLIPLVMLMMPLAAGGPAADALANQAEDLPLVFRPAGDRPEARGRPDGS